MATIKKHVKAVIQLRRATELEWINLNPILRLGEPAFSTDIYKLKIGDGETHWKDLEYLEKDVSESVVFINTTEGLDGEFDKLYVNTNNLTISIWNGENFEELEDSSIDDLKTRINKAENDIIELTEEVIKGADKNFVYKQSSASDMWTVVHNLGKYPSITVVDSAGTVVVGEIVLQTTEQAVISFNGAFSGKAYCN